MLNTRNRATSIPRCEISSAGAGKWRFRWHRKLWDRYKLQRGHTEIFLLVRSIPTRGVARSRRNRKRAAPWPASKWLFKKSLYHAARCRLRTLFTFVKSTLCFLMLLRRSLRRNVSCLCLFNTQNDVFIHQDATATKNFSTLLNWFNEINLESRNVFKVPNRFRDIKDRANDRNYKENEIIEILITAKIYKLVKLPLSRFRFTFKLKSTVSRFSC